MVRAEIADSRLPELIRQVQAGDEILLTQDQEPVARLVPAAPLSRTALPFSIRSFSGHRIISPEISQADLSEELFGQK